MSREKSRTVNCEITLANEKLPELFDAVLLGNSRKRKIKNGKLENAEWKTGKSPTQHITITERILCWSAENWSLLVDLFCMVPFTVSCLGNQCMCAAGHVAFFKPFINSRKKYMSSWGVLLLDWFWMLSTSLEVVVVSRFDFKALKGFYAIKNKDDTNEFDNQLLFILKHCWWL